MCHKHMHLHRSILLSTMGSQCRTNSFYLHNFSTTLFIKIDLFIFKSEENCHYPTELALTRTFHTAVTENSWYIMIFSFRVLYFCLFV